MEMAALDRGRCKGMATTEADRRDRVRCREMRNMVDVEGIEIMEMQMAEDNPTDEVETEKGAEGTVAMAIAMRMRSI